MEITEVERRNALNWLDMYLDNTKIAKLIVGAKNVGKSTLISQFVRKLVSSGVPGRRILYIDLDSPSDEFDDKESLKLYIEKETEDEGIQYVILDEVFNIPGWEEIVNSKVGGKLDFYIIASNKDGQATELPDYVLCNYASIKLYPVNWLDLYMPQEFICKDLYTLMATVKCSDKLRRTFKPIQ